MNKPIGTFSKRFKKMVILNLKSSMDMAGTGNKLRITIEYFYFSLIYLKNELLFSARFTVYLVFNGFLGKV